GTDKIKLRPSHGVSTEANATNPTRHNTARRGPKYSPKKPSTGRISQPNEYRVNAPSPTMTPVNPAIMAHHLPLRCPSRAACSIKTRHQNSPRKITTSKMVESPETLNRQNKSEPANTSAEIQATVASNRRRARRNTSTIATTNRA